MNELRDLGQMDFGTPRRVVYIGKDTVEQVLNYVICLVHDG
jgi:hypothetical protein